MSESVLLGDEALALGAVHAGLSCGFGYPGTPSTEILEFLIDNYEKNGGPLAQWCTNEKTAYESALGASFVGKRTIVTMKHVGLNACADAFMNSSLLGINGGLVVVVADDPSMHSSQGEQDTRYYADFAMIPCFEPTTQQEAYEMMFDAFEVSEKNHVPVIMRMVTRLSHSRAVVHPYSEDKFVKQNELSKGNRTEWMLLPALARKNYNRMLEKQADFISCVAFDKRAETIANYFKKGQKIGIEGALRIGSYTDKQGNKRTTADIWVNNFEFIEKKEINGDNGSGFEGMGSAIDFEEPPF